MVQAVSYLVYTSAKFKFMFFLAQSQSLGFITLGKNLHFKTIWDPRRICYARRHVTELKKIFNLFVQSLKY